MYTLEELTKRTHPEWDDYNDYWNFLYASYKGGFEYVSEDVVDNYLFSHRLETDADFLKRKERAYYLNYCRRIIDNYTNFIFAEGKSIQRSTDPELNSFFENTDGKGTSINDIMKKIGCLSSVYGRVDVLLDAPIPGKKSYTVREAKEGKLFPYIVIRNPIETVDWSVDIFGNLNWVLYKYVFYDDDDPFKERDLSTDAIYRYKLITKDKWVEFNYGGKIIAQGANSLQELFVHRSMHRSDSGLLAVSQIADIAYINREIFNWCSLMSEQIYRQTFSQLIVPDDGEYFDSGDEGVRENKFTSKIGTAYAFTFPASAGHPPAYISPDQEQIEVIWKMITAHIDEIYKLAGLSGAESNEVASGRAKQQQFMSVEASLKAKAEELEKTENAILRLFRKRQGKTLEKKDMSVYPRDFDILNFVEQLETDFKVCSSGISTTLNKYILQKVSDRYLASAPYEIREQVTKEIEGGDGSILVQGAGNIYRISAETDSIIAGSNSSEDSGAPGEEQEPTSVKARRKQEGEGDLTSKVRRKKNMDNKGNQASKNTNIE